MSSSPKLLRILIAAVMITGLPKLSFSQQTTPCSNQAVPPGAQKLNYVKRVFCVVPTLADITTDNSATANLYSGAWYAAAPTPLSNYRMSGPTLVLLNGGGVATERRNSTAGALPLLLASAGFYVEFQERLSDNDADHFPAVWLMPLEHDGRKDDHVPGDPAGFEHWMELDVDEGGWNAGALGTMLNWSGISPNYQKVNLQVGSNLGMDRTEDHIFGASYDPKARQVTWWVDGISVGSVSTAAVPSFINTYHYYLLINNQNHGKNKPYEMYIPYFSAWTGADTPMAPTGLKVTSP